MKAFVVRYPDRAVTPERVNDAPQEQWMGGAEDPVEAAKLATVKGPFPLDCGTLRVFDQDATERAPGLVGIDVTIEERLASLRTVEHEVPDE